MFFQLIIKSLLYNFVITSYDKKLLKLLYSFKINLYFYSINPAFILLFTLHIMKMMKKTLWVIKLHGKDQYINNMQLSTESYWYNFFVFEEHWEVLAQRFECCF